MSKPLKQRLVDGLMSITIGDDRWQHLRRADSCRAAAETGHVVFDRAREPTDIHEHLTTLYMLTREFRLDPVLELGTRTGESTVAFCQAASEIGGSVVSVDIEDCPEAKRAIRAAGLDKTWSFHRHDDLTFHWEAPIGCLFIDTSHEYEHTRRELAKYEPHVKRGGIIILHDYVGCPGVERAVREYTESRPDLRVYRYYNNQGLAVIFKA